MIEPNSPLRSSFNGPAATMRLAIFLGLIGLYLSLTTVPSLPHSALNLALSVACLALVMRTRLSQKSEPVKIKSLSALLLGIVGTAVGTMSLGAGILLQSEISHYENCSIGAITHAAANICQTQLRDDINARISSLRGLQQKG